MLLYILGLIMGAAGMLIYLFVGTKSVITFKGK